MKYLKVFILSLLIFSSAFNNFSQNDSPNINEIYQKAMDFYKQKDYKNSALEFDKIYPAHSSKINNNYLYDGVCIYALNNEKPKAFEILNNLVFQKFYFNLNHITSDIDLVNLHNEPQWQNLIEQVKENLRTLPERRKGFVKNALLKAKEVLASDNGKLWGESIWCDDLLVLDADNTVYSLSPFPESKTDDSVLYYQTFPPNTFSFSNSAQDYKGKKYAVVLTNYLSDNSATIIHELFHILQFKKRQFNGFAINYLDNYDAREWLRLEYQALKSCLKAIDEKQSTEKVLLYLKDAMIYRKIRQTKYQEYLAPETEIETLEGLANYTGYVLSTYPNKFEIAISEINNRERSKTYIRPFAYATGLAYGLIFDHLKMDWKSGVNFVYNYLDIYEKKQLKNQLNLENIDLNAVNVRNNFTEIHQQELIRKEKIEKQIAILKKEFIENPTLSVSLKDSNYTQTSDMDSTIVLEGIGTVYKNISCRDSSGGKNFGGFKTLTDSAENVGVLQSLDGLKFTFTTPFKIEGNKIIGKNYEIELAGNWTVKQKNAKGDFEIVEK